MVTALMSFIKKLRKIGNRGSSSKEIVKDINIKYNSTPSFEEMDPIKYMKELGYGFNPGGQLRKLAEDGLPGDEPFQFNVSDQHQECQAHYEKLGDAITGYIYHLLEKQENLTRLSVPEGFSDGTFIFVSQDYDKKDVLMVLINGSGAVRAGQWARSLIINDCLDMGTQIPYVQRAVSKGYGVMILNTNDNCLPNGMKIPHSGTAEEHARYVWDTYISKAVASSVVIVAHSYGGVVTLTLADQLKDQFDERVKAIAFTDSVHPFSNIKSSQHFREISRNWISSSAPIDTPMNTPEFDCTRVSAGHAKHEMTSYACIESVFKFIEEKLDKK